MRWFIFIEWDDEIFFFEVDEPLKLYGPAKDLDEAFIDLAYHLLAYPVDYWEIPVERYMIPEVGEWN